MIRAILNKILGRGAVDPESASREASLGTITGQMRALARLGSVPLPRIIHVETRSRCNGSCSFCLAAARTDPRPDLRMEPALFDKIIAELAELGFANRLSLYNNNEPLIDPLIFSRLAQARKALPNAYMEIKTNGLNLTLPKVHQLFDAGLDMLYINQYLAEDDPSGPPKRDNLRALSDALQHMRRFKGHFDGTRYFTRILITRRARDEQLGSRAGTAPNRDPLSDPITRICLRPFEMMTIAPDGRVALCSDDLLFAKVMGNVAEQSIQEIWNAPAYHDVRLALLDGHRARYPETCARCDNRGHTWEILQEWRDAALFEQARR